MSVLRRTWWLLLAIALSLGGDGWVLCVGGIDPALWDVSTLATGIDIVLSVSFSPDNTFIAALTWGNLMLEKNRGPFTIRLVPLGLGKVSSDKVTNLVGPSESGYVNGAANVARFDGPTAIAVSRDGMWICVADTANHKIRLELLLSPALSSWYCTIGCANGQEGMDGVGEDLTVCVCMWYHVGMSEVERDP